MPLIGLYADFLLVKAPVALHNNKRYRVFIIFLITFSLRESVPIAPDLNAMYPPVEDHINTVRLEKR